MDHYIEINGRNFGKLLRQRIIDALRKGEGYVIVLPADQSDGYNFGIDIIPVTRPGRPDQEVDLRAMMRAMRKELGDLVGPNLGGSPREERTEGVTSSPGDVQSPPGRSSHQTCDWPGCGRSMGNVHGKLHERERESNR